MLTTEEILSSLDNCHDGYYNEFVSLGHPYTFLIDSRINVFRDDKDKWAIAVEVLGYNPRADAITLDINYFGNCLIDLELCNDRPVNTYRVHPIHWDNFRATIDNERLRPDVEFWIIRDIKVKLSHSRSEYSKAGIELKEFEPNAISLEEVGRLLIITHQDLFRATDKELYKSIPASLNKILVIDEWFHKDYHQFNSGILETELPTTGQLEDALKQNPDLLGKLGIEKDSFKSIFQNQLVMMKEQNLLEWKNNRPGSYETWQQIANVIVTGDKEVYKPTLQPNSHWKNWPDSGSL